MIWLGSERGTSSPVGSAVILGMLLVVGAVVTYLLLSATLPTTNPGAVSITEEHDGSIVVEVTDMGNADHLRVEYEANGTYHQERLTRMDDRLEIPGSAIATNSTITVFSEHGDMTELINSYDPVGVDTHSSAPVCGDVDYMAGDGSASDPFVVTTDYELQCIQENPSAHYVLGNDIDASGTAEWNGGAGFEPITFSGTLDGQGYEIRGLTIDRGERFKGGIFSEITGGGAVSDVHIVNADVRADGSVGPLVGWVEDTGTIEDSSATGVVVRATGNSDGDSHWGEGRGVYAGGLVGFNEGYVNGSSADGDIAGYGLTGGLLGYNDLPGEVHDSSANTRVELYPSGFKARAGGLVGTNQNLIANSSAAGTVYGVRNVTAHTGGFAGYNSPTGTIRNSSASTDVIRGTTMGGLVGVSYGVIDDSIATGDVDGEYFVGGLTGRIRHNALVTGSRATGDVTGERYIGGLAGDQHGDLRDSSATGSVSGNLTTGGLVGFHSAGTVRNSSASGDVSVDGEWGGGLFGATYGAVTGSSASGDVTGTSMIGGFAGKVDNSSSVTASFATGNVTADGERIGGFAGKIANGSTVSRSYATGAVTGDDEVGGFAGILWNSRLETSYALGSASGNKRVGGLVGVQWGELRESYAAVPVDGNVDVGGVVGDSDGTETTLYWDRTVGPDTTEDDSGAGTPLHTEEMQGDDNKLDGFDFEDTWRTHDTTYPTHIPESE